LGLLCELLGVVSHVPPNRFIGAASNANSAFCKTLEFGDIPVCSTANSFIESFYISFDLEIFEVSALVCFEIQ
jgi:hypothetical protein